MEDYHLKNKKILTIAKNIFGDIVKNAYIAYFDKDLISGLVSSYKKLKDDSILLPYDSDDIVLEFSNGNLVKFSNSEWASISKIETLNII